MISIITPTYNTDPEVLARTWASLKAQTFTDWEWVIWDDSTNTETWSQLYGFCSDERYKIAMHRSHVHSGNIGDVKRNAFMVSKGDILVELDHDDELTPDCLQEIYNAFQDPDVGFVYSDWCELLPNGESGVYPQGWAFGFGSEYWSEQYGVWVMSAPEINDATIRHIVSAPNHVRAWRADVYRSLNGHDPKYPVADDYELIVRTFLATKMVHIPKLLYKQHIGPSTAQRVRNDQIQTLVADIANLYADAITARFFETK
jgi:glycosyltransferase involved in cell wall biosynthesis